MGEHHLDLRPASTEPSAIVRCSFLTGCCLLMRAEAIREVGAFRADYFAYMEDLEFSIRLEEHRWQLGWVPAARMRHKVPPVGAPDSPMQIRLRDRNRRRIVREHYAPLQALAFWGWFLPTRLVHWLRFTLHGDGARAGAIIAGLTER
jgi:GT2 family glycosyltransferase